LGYLSELIQAYFSNVNDMVKYGKPCSPLIHLKKSFLTDNEKLLHKAKKIAEIYSKQPKRKKCKNCRSKIEKPMFKKFNVEYSICSLCGHLNGLYEDTDDFCKSIYTENHGKEYANNYHSSDKKEYKRRVDDIYMPKAIFLKNTLEEQNEVTEELTYTDIGAGSGYFVSALIASGLRKVSGYEASEYQVNYANQMLGKKYVHCNSLDGIETIIENIIHTSTSEVYGSAQYVPIDEKHPLQAQSPYAASKISADKIAESFYLSYDMPVSTIRPFNIYGPRQSARAVIPTIITQALTQDVVNLGSLYPTRDYTYVTDTVEAFIKIAENEKTVGKTYNIGTNKEISIGDLAKKICALINPDCKIIQERKRMRPENSEVDRLLADNTKAKEEIGWLPTIMLEKGLQNTIHYIKSNTQKYHKKEYVI
ncbi:NAD-dependent dehydratase, partial [Candidatus Magnetomorum sp. HK-1]